MADDAQLPATSSNGALARSTNAMVLRGLGALSSKPPFAVLAEGNRILRRRLLRNTKFPREGRVQLLRYLAESTHLYTRWAVARDLDAPIDVLQRLAVDTEKTVRSNLCGNEKTPVEILVRFGAESDYTIRCNVTRNPNTPDDVLIR